jgi:hypothetical protein
MLTSDRPSITTVVLRVVGLTTMILIGLLGIFFGLGCSSPTIPTNIPTNIAFTIEAPTTK